MAGTVTVFGGTGFLGRRAVLHLRDKGFPSGSRHGLRSAGGSTSEVTPHNCASFAPTFMMMAP
jgi:uncharacterized protein YbjT (DUF2867 family)